MADSYISRKARDFDIVLSTATAVATAGLGLTASRSAIPHRVRAGHDSGTTRAKATHYESRMGH